MDFGTRNLEYLVFESFRILKSSQSSFYLDPTVTGPKATRRAQRLSFHMPMGPGTGTSKIAKIVDPILPIYSLFWDIGPLFWALLEVQVIMKTHLTASEDLMEPDPCALHEVRLREQSTFRGS